MSSSEESVHSQELENEISEASDKEDESRSEESSGAEDSKGNNNNSSSNRKVPLPSRSARLQKSSSDESAEAPTKDKKGSRSKREAVARIASYADEQGSDESGEGAESESFKEEVTSEEDEEDWGAEGESGSDFESEMKKGKAAAGKVKKVVTPTKRAAKPTRSSTRKTGSKKKGSYGSDESVEEESYVPRPSKRRQLASERRGRKEVAAEGSASNDSD